jgi:hypothetical protein
VINFIEALKSFRRPSKPSIDLLSDDFIQSLPCLFDDRQSRITKKQAAVERMANARYDE